MVHNCVFSIDKGGYSRDPGVGMVHIKAPKALTISLIGGSLQAFLKAARSIFEEAFTLGLHA